MGREVGTKGGGGGLENPSKLNKRGGWKILENFIAGVGWGEFCKTLRGNKMKR